MRLGAQTNLATPGFHHLHLNSVNPDAAIDFYVKAFPATSKTTFAGPALASPNNVLVLFNQVATPPATHVTLVPLYTGLPAVASAKEGDGVGTSFISSDTYPGTGGILGLTLAQVADAEAKGVKPNGGAGLRLPARAG